MSSAGCSGGSPTPGGDASALGGDSGSLTCPAHPNDLLGFCVSTDSDRAIAAAAGWPAQSAVSASREPANELPERLGLVQWSLRRYRHDNAKLWMWASVALWAWYALGVSASSPAEQASRCAVGAQTEAGHSGHCTDTTKDRFNWDSVGRRACRTALQRGCLVWSRVRQEHLVQRRQVPRI